MTFVYKKPLPTAWWEEIKRKTRLGILLFMVLTYSTPVRPVDDPCNGYLYLPHVKRNVSYVSDGENLCDVGLIISGQWYRFEMSDGAKMPVTCPNRLSCGTRLPIWLDGAHPTDNNTKSIYAYGRKGSNCKFFEYSIQVKRCLADNRRGVFYVYQLEVPRTCASAYCAEPGNDWCSSQHEWDEQKKSCIARPTLPPFFTTRPPPTYAEEELEEYFEQTTNPVETDETGDPGDPNSKTEGFSRLPIIIGIAVAGSILICLLVCVIVAYLYSRSSHRHKRNRTEIDIDQL